MKRSLLTLAIFVALSAWASAGAENAGRPSAPEQARLLHRNRALLEALIDGGLKLAAEGTNPLDRAAGCQLLAVRLKDELRQTAPTGESHRAAELFRHLRTLLDNGLAPNLQAARKGIPAGSQDERRLIELRDQARQLCEQLEETLNERRLPDGEAGHDALAGSKALLEAAVRP